jgi:hypothetical protein
VNSCLWNGYALPPNALSMECRKALQLAEDKVSGADVAKRERGDVMGYLQGYEGKGDVEIDQAWNELQNAMNNWPKFNSAHEGFAVLKEEVDELWEHVKTNQKNRDLKAMALRFAYEICNEESGRK